MPASERLDQQMRRDLRTLLKERDRFGATVLRTVLTAIDNASAVPESADDEPTRDFSGERPRRDVTGEEMQRILAEQIAEREDAIETYERHGATERAESIRQEVRILTPYCAPDGSAV